MTTALRPRIVGDWWRIAPTPDLDGLLPPPQPGTPRFDAYNNARAHNEPVDHHIFRGPDGTWHLWGCVRNTAVGRILMHWDADELTDSPWRDTREVIRCDQDAGESLDDWHGQEWIQSPYFVENDGVYYMFYGGHSAAIDPQGNPVPGDDEANQCQICLMTSTDGRRWTRRRDGNCYSRLFVGPGETRDPCVIRAGGRWIMYYAGYDGPKAEAGAFFARISEDLIDWSEPVVVLRDHAHGRRTWACECPHVVERGGAYYLFRTVNYYDANTQVYRSDDPLDFGRDDASAAAGHVCRFPAAAVEIYEVEGEEYVSSNHDPVGGTLMARMTWEKV